MPTGNASPPRARSKQQCPRLCRSGNERRLDSFGGLLPCVSHGVLPFRYEVQEFSRRHLPTLFQIAPYAKPDQISPCVSSSQPLRDYMIYSEHTPLFSRFFQRAFPETIGTFSLLKYKQLGSALRSSPVHLGCSDATGGNRASAASGGSGGFSSL